MEIITTLVGVSFAVFVSILATAPNPLALLLGRRARKHQAGQRNLSGLQAV